MHVAVIGVGRIGALHAATLLRSPGTTTVTVSDSNVTLAREVAMELGAEPAPIDSAIAQSDAVVICSPTSTHADLILQSVGAGKPTFCEKPISTDLASADRVVDEVLSSRGRVQMGFQRRFDRGYQSAEKLMSSGDLGELYTVRMASHDTHPPNENYIANSGGLFRDLSIHDFDALRFVTGQEVLSVYADASVIGFPVFAKYGDVDTGAALLRLESGALGILSAARHNPRGYDVRMELHGSRESVIVGWDERTPIDSLEQNSALSGPPYLHFQDRFRDAYERELNAFLEYARGERQNPCTVSDAREALRVAIACNMSVCEQRPILMSEVR